MKKILQLTCLIFLFQYSTFAQYTLQNDDVEVDADGYITSCSKTFTGAETDIIIPNELDGLTVKGIADKYPSNTGVFANKNLTTVQLPATLEYIGNFAFINNNITDANFTDCTALTYIGWSSFSSNELTTVDLSACTSLEVIFKFAFYKNSITTLVLPVGLPELESACFNRNQITSVNGKSSNGLLYKCNNDGSTDSTVIVSYGGNATHVNFIPSNVKEFGESAFYRTVAQTIDMSNLKTLSSIGYLCFQYSDITTIDLTSCTSLIFIGDDAFNMTNVTSFNLPTPSIPAYEFVEWQNESGEAIPLTGGMYIADTVRSSYTAIMNKLGNQLTIIVNNGTVPVEGATVDLEGYSEKQTDANGTVVYENVLEGAQTYTITAQGFQTLNGTLTMANSDMNETVTLTEESTTMVKSINRTDLKIWPNPSTEKVFIKSDKIIKTIALYAISGELLTQYNVEAKSTEIDLSNYNSGLIILKTKYNDGIASVNKIVNR